MKLLRLVEKTIRLAILRIGPGWMFGLLTFNFNRITMYELGAMGLIVTTLIGLHHFLSPLQVMWGHFADRHPIFGYRRTPYILVSGLVGALVFVALPMIAIALGNQAQAKQWPKPNDQDFFLSMAFTLSQHPNLVLLIAFVLFVLFGVAMAANGNSSAALIAEVVEQEHRGSVFVVVWLFMIFSSIVSAGVTKVIMPVYDPQSMQLMYTLTLPIVLVSSLIGLAGMEKRISPEEHAVYMAQKRLESSTNHAFRVFWQLLKSNTHVRGFFFFVLLAIFGIFLQDALLEVFGGDVFRMEYRETAGFTQSWGTGMLIGIALTVVFTRFQPISRKDIASIGGLGIALSLVCIAISSLIVERTLVTPALLLMGISTGLFNIGALSLMMDMTVEGHTGLYMGMWGLAQGLGNGLANSLSGALHTILIETQLLHPTNAYGLIYGLEALIMILAVIILRGISVQDFKIVSNADVRNTLAFETAT